MIVTLTANPSNDRTLSLSDTLVRGGVLRAPTATVEPAGKGVNVARAAGHADVEALAVIPANPSDPYVTALTARGVAHRVVPIAGAVRTNVTLAEPDGTTTKVNELGPTLDEAEVAALVDAVVDAAARARWVVLAGSLAPGAPADLYATITGRLADLDVRVAVDTSGPPLEAVTNSAVPPSLIKPNAEELASIVGGDPDQFEADPGSAVPGARQLVAQGIEVVLLTLGSAGTLVATADEVLFAPPLQIEPRSTVGAGDSALTGWVLASLAGHDTATCLRWATAWGAAAVSLPGSQLPTPAMVRPDQVDVHALDTGG